MITLFIGSSLNPKEVVVSMNKSIKEIFNENNINIPVNSILTANSKRLGDRELDLPISDIGITDGMIIAFAEKLTGNK